MMRVCVTGCGGASGKLFCQTFGDNYRIRGTDVKSAPHGLKLHDFVLADIRKLEEVTRALEGQEVVLHTAAAHPFYQFGEEEYLDINVKGTFNVFEAARRCGVRRVVFVSTVSVIGYDRRSSIVDERAERRPTDLYGFTKVLGEDIARHYSERYGLSTVCPRLGTFVPCDEITEGIQKFVGFRVDIRDVVRAYELAVRGDVEGCFFVVPRTPYEEEDLPLLQGSPWALVEKYYPQAMPWFRKAGREIGGFPLMYSLRRAREVAGFEPRHNFDEFLRERGI